MRGILSAVLTTLVIAIGEPTLARAEAERSTRSGEDWYRFLGPTLDSKSKEMGIRTDWSEDRLPVLWNRAVGEGYSAPTVAFGRVFFFDRKDDMARVVALDATTGAEIWQAEYPTQYVDMYGYSGGPRASPVVDGDRVYLFGVEGSLRALRFEDGELLWEIDTTGMFHVVQNFFGVGATPIVEGDLLIVMVGGSPPDSPPIHSEQVRGDGSGIVAFDKRTGAIRYKLTDELASYSSPVIHEIGGRRWGLALMRGGLVGFDPALGKVEFEFPWRARKLESVNAATPILVDGAVLITESYGPGGALVRPRPGDYEVIWSDSPKERSKKIAAHWSTPIYHRGHIYGSSGESSGNSDIRCLEASTGRVLWAEKLPRATLLYADGHFVVLTERGRLLLVRAQPTEFESVTEIDLGAQLGFPSWNAPVLSHGRLLIRGSKNLVALELIPPLNPQTRN